MDIRPVRQSDLPACIEVFYAAEDDLYGRLNQPLLPRNPQPLERLFGHILTGDLLGSPGASCHGWPVACS